MVYRVIKSYPIIVKDVIEPGFKYLCVQDDGEVCVETVDNLEEFERELRGIQQNIVRKGYYILLMIMVMFTKYWSILEMLK